MEERTLKITISRLDTLNFARPPTTNLWKIKQLPNIEDCLVFNSLSLRMVDRKVNTYLQRILLRNPFQTREVLHFATTIVMHYNIIVIYYFLSHNQE